MWLKKLKFNKKDKADLKSLFRFVFPKMANKLDSMKPPLPIPKPIPWSQLHNQNNPFWSMHKKIEMGPPNLNVIVKDVLDNIETIDGVLNNIPVIKIDLKPVAITARTRKLKSKYKLEYDDTND